MSDPNSTPSYKVPLDERYYHLDEEELAFFKSQIGIQDDAALKQHILQVQANAYEVHPYPCIRRFSFTKLKISRLPAYNQLLALGRERKGAIFIDIGCCFGNDVRKAIADGYPLQYALASDIEPEFWQLGHQLFRSKPETFPVPFIPGDAFSPSFLPTVGPFYSAPETSAPSLATLTSLASLVGHVSAIHASSFFHLFSEENQLKLARSLAGLLSPEPGSMMFGSHAALPEKGLQSTRMPSSGTIWSIFCHSPDSWKDLWDGQVFEKGTVKVDAKLCEVPRTELSTEGFDKFWYLEWSVTRL